MNDKIEGLMKPGIEKGKRRECIGEGEQMQVLMRIELDDKRYIDLVI